MLDDPVNTFMLKWGIPTLVATVTTPSASGTFSYSNLRAQGDSVHQHFLLSSIAKTFTAFAAINFRTSLGYDLGDPVIAHIPQIANRTNIDERVKIIDLLGHTAGINSTRYNWLKISNEEASKSLLESMLDRDYLPTVKADDMGSWAYSNAGYDLLGALIETKSGLAYSAFMQDAVLKPLGMNDTTLDVVPAASICVPTIYTKGEILPLAMLPHAVRHQPSAVFYSTPQDVARWGAFLASQGDTCPELPLSPSIFDLMWTPRTTTSIQYCDSYGLGWYVSRWRGCSVVGHGGRECGFNTLLLVFPDDGVSLSILMNTQVADTVLFAAGLAKQLMRARVISPRQDTSEG